MTAHAKRELEILKPFPDAITIHPGKNETLLYARHSVVVDKVEAQLLLQLQQSPKP